MRLRNASPALLVLIAAAGQGAAAAPIAGLFDTGVNGSGTQLALGSQDAHWLVDGAAPVVYTNAAYHVPSDAEFIGVNGSGGYVINPNTYTLTFSLAGLDPAAATLSGGFEADNYASAYLNGHLIAQDPVGTISANFQSLTPFSAPSADFVAGSNVLSFVVTDTGPPSGLLVSGLSGASDSAGVPAPEPSAAALLAVAAACASRFRRSGTTSARG
jgi:hypothetical protein